MLVNGWFDWAVRVPGPLDKVNGGINPVHAITFHSAEGYKPGLLSQLANAPVSWHLSNLQDGTMWQHYPLSAQCWHATAFNNFCIGMEHEGVVGTPFNALQITNDQRVIKEVSEAYGWVPKRPISSTDLTATLYEHGEVVRLKGGMGSSCPNHRIPWDKILGQEYGPMNLNADGSDRIVSEGAYIVMYQDNVPIKRWGGETPGQEQKNFGGVWYTVIHGPSLDGGHTSPMLYSDKPGD